MNKQFVDELSSILFLYRKCNFLNKKANVRKISEYIANLLQKLVKPKQLSLYHKIVLQELPKIRDNPNMPTILESMKEQSIINYINYLVQNRKQTLMIQKRLINNPAKNIFEYNQNYKKKHILNDKYRKLLFKKLGVVVHRNSNANSVLNDIVKKLMVVKNEHPPRNKTITRACPSKNTNNKTITNRPSSVPVLHTLKNLKKLKAISKPVLKNSTSRPMAGKPIKRVKILRTIANKKAKVPVKRVIVPVLPPFMELKKSHRVMNSDPRHPRASINNTLFQDSGFKFKSFKNKTLLHENNRTPQLTMINS